MPSVVAPSGGKGLVSGDLRRTQTVVQNGDNPLNRFIVERVHRSSLLAPLERPIILLPALGDTNAEYTVGDASGGSDFANSTAAHLANDGADVFLYSGREALLAPGACASIDCSVMASWGVAARLDDLEFVRARVAELHGFIRPVIGGHSFGAMTAIAAINQNPHAYAGAVLYEGTMAIANPQLQPAYQAICGGLRAEIAAGQVFDDTIDPTGQLLLQLEENVPTGPTPLSIFPPGTTNRLAYLLFLSAPSAGPPQSLFPPGFLLDAAAIPDNRFVFASEPRLASLLGSSTYYIANAELADPACAIGGDPTFTSNLSSFTAPVLAIEAQKGFGVLEDDSLALLGSHDVTKIFYSGQGHEDAIASGDHSTLLEAPITEWLRHHVL